MTGKGPAAQTRARAPRNKGDVMLKRDPDDSCNFVSIRKQEHGIRCMPVKGKAIAFVSNRLLRLGKDILRPDCLPQLVEDRMFQGLVPARIMNSGGALLAS